MTATLQHTSWCNQQDVVDEAGVHDCGRTVLIFDVDAGVELQIGADGKPRPVLWSNGNGDVTPHEARTLGTGLIEMAALADGRALTSAVVARNLAALIASRLPLKVDDVEAIADLFGVPVERLVSEDFDPTA